MPLSPFVTKPEEAPITLGDAGVAPAGPVIVVAVTPVAVDYTVLKTDSLLTVDTTSGNRTITLPPAADVVGMQVVVKRTSAGANTLTVDGDGAETIDGAATKSLPSQYDVLRVVSDGTAWWTT